MEIIGLAYSGTAQEAPVDTSPKPWVSLLDLKIRAQKAVMLTEWRKQLLLVWNEHKDRQRRYINQVRNRVKFDSSGVEDARSRNQLMKPVGNEQK